MTTEDTNKTNDIEILPEDYANYDLSFKIIVIGNSGNIYILLFIKILYNRSW